MGMEMDMGPASMDATGRPPLSWAGAPSPGLSLIHNTEPTRRNQ